MTIFFLFCYKITCIKTLIRKKTWPSIIKGSVGAQNWLSISCCICYFTVFFWLVPETIYNKTYLNVKKKKKSVSFLLGQTEKLLKSWYTSVEAGVFILLVVHIFFVLSKQKKLDRYFKNVFIAWYIVFRHLP